MKPVGVQFAITICPPGRHTPGKLPRNNLGAGSNIAANMLTTMSKVPF
jgi:hypothetical protein